MRIYKSKTYQILALAAVLVVAADIGVRIVNPDEPVTLTDRLVVQPVDGGVYILGNSMFKTGVDLDQMRSELPDRDVRFNYYDGHYTNLWYLVAEGALRPAEHRPALIVWGFRPHYAIYPAFRQNQPNANDLFVFPDRAYERLTDASMDRPVADVEGLLEAWSALYSERDEAQGALSRASERVSLAVLDWVLGRRVSSLRERLLDGDISIIDEIARAATHGEVQLAEEQIVDGAGDFITGPPRVFTDGFIPLTAESFQDSGLPQLVVIWKPVNVAEGDPIEEEDTFVSDAIAFFDAHDIPYLDLYHDDRIVREHFAKGDHHNAEGRGVVTSILTERIRSLLDQS